MNDLHRVVKTKGKTDILNFLLNQNPDLKATDDKGNTVLYLVLTNDKLTHREMLEIVKNFLERDVDPNVKNCRQETALHLAVARRMKDVIETLISYNADIKGYHITHFFIEDEYEKFKPYLENHDPSFQNIEEKEKESESFLEWLLAKGFDFDSSKLTHDPLQCKIHISESKIGLVNARNLLHFMPVLLRGSDNPNYLYSDRIKSFLLPLREKPVPKAYYERHICRIMKSLFDNEKSWVMIEDNEDIRFKELIDRFSKDDSKCAESLFHAVMRGCKYWTKSTTECNFEILRNLVERGVNVNTPNVSETRPVFWAVSAWNLQALKFLKENGADFQVKDPNGRNLLEQLVFSRCYKGEDDMLEVFEFLINRGYDVNGKDNRGSTPLHLAAEVWNFRIASSALSLLLRHGAQVDARDADGETPLHRAVTKGHRDANVQELLEWGANVNDECMINLHFDRLLMRHRIKLRAADLPLASKFDVYDEDDQRFYESCLKEVTKLKSTFIDNRTTLYQLLRLDLSRRSIGVKNEMLKNLVDSPKLKYEFPLYSGVILASYREAAMRKKLLEPAKEAWLKLTEIYLPDICIERIFAYLRNVDLANMIEEVKMA